jgi:hypothetical protein
VDSPGGAPGFCVEFGGLQDGIFEPLVEGYGTKTSSAGLEFLFR